MEFRSFNLLVFPFPDFLFTQLLYGDFATTAFLSQTLLDHDFVGGIDDTQSGIFNEFAFLVLVDDLLILLQSNLVVVSLDVVDFSVIEANEIGVLGLGKTRQEDLVVSGSLCVELVGHFPLLVFLSFFSLDMPVVG